MSRLQKGQSLVGTIVAVLILVGVAVYFFTGGFGDKNPENEREDGKGSTIIGKSRYAAEDDVCRQQLSQIRQLVQVAMDPVEDTYPASLSEVGGMPSGYDKCPIDHEDYEYDSTDGTVTCPHAGHENY